MKNLLNLMLLFSVTLVMHSWAKEKNNASSNPKKPKISIQLPASVIKVLCNHVEDYNLLSKNGVDPNNPIPPRKNNKVW